MRTDSIHAGFLYLGHIHRDPRSAKSLTLTEHVDPERASEFLHQGFQQAYFWCIFAFLDNLVRQLKLEAILFVLFKRQNIKLDVTLFFAGVLLVCDVM